MSGLDGDDQNVSVLCSLQISIGYTIGRRNLLLVGWTRAPDKYGHTSHFSVESGGVLCFKGQLIPQMIDPLETNMHWWLSEAALLATLYHIRAQPLLT
mgnify:FL=1